MRRRSSPGSARVTLEADLLRPDQPFTLRQPRPDLDDDAAFLDLRRAHPDLRIETDQEGTLIVMSPTGWRSSNRNARITAQLLVWAERDGTGQVSDSSIQSYPGFGSTCGASGDPRGHQQTGRHSRGAGVAWSRARSRLQRRSPDRCLAPPVR